ncbi:MAG TPA: class I SAM-dependent methyltransferase [Candidatus Sulfotelmatobacter sp.]|jgi:SAM-dependent methyltransferase|nr:class I SAM-dependent methyltransferase [Candidatus Sulfotelmatobacter sp.]
MSERTIGPEKIEARTVFGTSSERYAAVFSGVTAGYRISEQGILDAMRPHLLDVQKSGRTPFILEVGSGTGQATKRIEKGLRIDGIESRLATSEYSEAMIRAGIGREDANRPQVAAAAEALPYPTAGSKRVLSGGEIQEFEGFDAVFGSQTIHWWENIEKGLREANRVLRPGGKAIFAASGILEGYGDLHFTEDPAYKAYLGYVQEDLEARELWREDMGEFSPKNSVVNPFFHRHSIDEVNAMLESAGFENVQRHEYDLQVDKQEMINRLGPGAASMFIFAGDYAKDITADVRTEIVTKATKRLQDEHPELLDQLNDHPTHEPIPVYSATKPESVAA